MPTQNVNLTEQQSAFIKGCMTNGRYKNASEVVRAALRLLEQQEEQDRLKLERLRAEVQKGADDLANGRYTAINGREELEAFMADIAREADAQYESEIRDAKTPKV